MTFEMRMPDLATTGSPMKVVRWLVQVGQHVERGQALLEVETDKAVMQVESVVSGRVSSISVTEGEEVSAGQVISSLETDRPAATIAVKQTQPVTTASPAGPSSLESPASRPSFFARNRQARMSRTAEKQGPEGIAGPRAIPLTVPQRVVAHSMEQSKRTVPHFYLQTSASADAMAARRTAVAGKTLLWDAFFVHAAGEALLGFERMACRFESDHLVEQGIDAVGLAVDLNGDLFTLAIQQPASKTIEQISDEITSGVARLRSGDPTARRSRRANLTISNLGGSNVESFCAVINPPESATLAVGKVMPVVTVVEGQIVVQKRVNLTLSVDHRVASGTYAAGFLAAIVEHVESC
jgi:pyruvate dehydrogenase E2 component (dihydrolipoamide acetyltransferase)